jgi:DNA helicase-4
LKVFEKFFAQYQDRLKRTNEIDFEDMIVSASRALEAGLVQRRYKVILVDEFQDISQSRARLLKALLRQAPDCKLFAVGDDWQSINRFAGADLSLFTDFQEHFGVSACNFLTQTFRSNQGITNLASRFIQRNPRQVQRSISAHDKRETGVWSVYRYKSADEQLEICETLLETLSAQRRQQGTRATVFILHRYRHQAPSMLEAWRARFREDLTIDASTIHRAKGKQADYVILLGLTSGAEAFPSEIEDDPLLELVMPVPECFPNSEERRLFYVALTRAQHHVFLLGSVRSPSTFLTELLADKASTSMLRAVTKRANSKGFLREECPECDSGVLLLQKGRYGEFMGCSGHPDCNYTKKISSRRLND